LIEQQQKQVDRIIAKKAKI